jgi:hypothetical protein
MGISVLSKNKSIDVTYGGFHKLRKHIVEASNNKQLIDLYDEFDLLYSKGTDKDLHNYDRKVNEFIHLQTDNDFINLIRFSYLPDSDGNITKSQCESLLKYISEDCIDFVIGFTGRSEPAKYMDFKNILIDGIENNGIRWY